MKTEMFVKDLDFFYKKRKKILYNISFSVKKGEFISIIGPSGCGKTTLLKLIGGLLSPSCGNIKIQDGSVKSALRKNQFGFVFQDPALLPWRTVKENINLPLEIINKSISGCEELLDLVKLKECKYKYPFQLSGGMRQKVAIARALAIDPNILLMDEPFSSLDDITREYLNNELLSIWQKVKSTILFVTHNLSEAVYLSDKVIVLSQDPATIKAVVDIDLKRPRYLDMKYSVKFNNLVKKVRSNLNGK